MHLIWDIHTRRALVDVNREINKMPYRTDMELYGVPEFWTIDGNRGDCDDYALKKRARLRELFPDHKDAFRIATCWVPPREYHAVLTVETSAGTLVLDNVHPHVAPFRSLPYRWHKREVPGGGWEDLSVWS